MRHKWTKQEIDLVRDNKDLPAAIIKKRFFSNKPDVSVKSIQRKKDQMRGETLARNKAKIEQWELDFIERNLDMKNSELSKIFQRKPDKIDQMRLMVRKKLGVRAKKQSKTLTESDLKKSVSKYTSPKDFQKNNSIKSENINNMSAEDILETDEIKNALIAIDFLKTVNPKVIDKLRKGRIENKDHYELVSLFDLFKVPQARHLTKNSAPKVLMANLQRLTQYYNRQINKISDSKSANVSTYQWNILRQICGIRITSWKNLVIHSSNNHKKELKAVSQALDAYLKNKIILGKAKPVDKPIRKVGLA